jgi:hypothetical protein
LRQLFAHLFQIGCLHELDRGRVAGERPIQVCPGVADEHTWLE